MSIFNRYHKVIKFSISPCNTYRIIPQKFLHITDAIDQVTVVLLRLQDWVAVHTGFTNSHHHEDE